MQDHIEFNLKRSQMYEFALQKFPLAREHDLKRMHELLNPQYSERILGFGEGNGYFCNAIAKAIGTDGRYVVTDPSVHQLDNLVKRVNYPQVEVICTGAERLAEGIFDKVWSFGAFHHCYDQQKAMQSISDSLRVKGRLVLCDVFAGSSLARHFDLVVAPYCETGHEATFLSDDLALSLCTNSELEVIDIVDISQQWKFQSEQDIGTFIYNLHALTKLPGTQEEQISRVIQGCKKILEISVDDEGQQVLHWPMKALIAEKK